MRRTLVIVGMGFFAAFLMAAASPVPTTPDCKAHFKDGANGPVMNGCGGYSCGTGTCVQKSLSVGLCTARWCECTHAGGRTNEHPQCYGMLTSCPGEDSEATCEQDEPCEDASESCPSEPDAPSPPWTDFTDPCACHIHTVIPD